MKELQELQETREKIIDYINKIDISDVKSNEISIRIGNEVIVFSQSNKYNLSSIEEEIREELKDKVNEKLKAIGEKLKERIEYASNMIDTYKSTYEIEKKKLEEKIKNAFIMPEITLEHAKKGLSVVRGNRNDEFIWIMNGVYNPKFVDKRMIEKKYRSMMLTQIVFLVTTKNDKVTGLDIVKPIGLGRFDHYHTGCWGDFKYSRKWSTPDDIIQLVKEAEIVLETINSMSLADRSPENLPRFSTLKNHLLNEGESDGESISNKHLLRAGVTESSRNDSDEVWGS